MTVFHCRVRSTPRTDANARRFNEASFLKAQLIYVNGSRYVRADVYALERHRCLLIIAFYLFFKRAGTITTNPWRNYCETKASNTSRMIFKMNTFSAERSCLQSYHCGIQNLNCLCIYVIIHKRHETLLVQCKPCLNIAL